ncbi:MAG: LPS assembly protein LptD [Phycisphaera sp.]|nr:LPS assembly protein LptD [Phycisphaera sp.]
MIGRATTRTRRWTARMRLTIAPSTTRRQRRARSRRNARRWSRRSVVLLVCGQLLFGASSVLRADDNTAPILSVDEVSPSEFVSDLSSRDAVIVADTLLKANRANAWRSGRTQWLLLDREVTVRVGDTGFTADRAVVRITPSETGTINTHDLAIYLDEAKALRGTGAVQADAKTLLVTATVRGQVNLDTNLLLDEPKSDNTFVAAGRGRMTEYDNRKKPSFANVPPTADLPVIKPPEVKPPEVKPPPPEVKPPPPEVKTPEVSPVKPTTTSQPGQATVTKPTTAPPTAATTDQAGIIPRQAVVHFIADRIVYERAPKDPQAPGTASRPANEDLLMLLGHVRVMVQSLTDDRVMTLTADNAVLFLAPNALGDLASGQAQATALHGVYLEDNAIATDGNFTARAPRVYYDLPTNKATLLDAVLYTWDFDAQAPMYVRAQRIRQESRTSWTADKAIVTTSDFAVPHMALASRKVHFTQRTRPDGTTRTHYVAKDNTVRFSGLPVFYWPTMSGDAEEDTPLRKVVVGHSTRNGMDVLTTWDLFALSGEEAPDGVRLDGNIDYRGNHGPALGTRLNYDMPEMFGTFDGYLAFWDNGNDDIGGRLPIEHAGDMRGFALWRHRHDLRNGWELSLEGSYVSDPTFLEEYFPFRTYEDKPYETSIYLKKQEGDTALTFLANYNFSEFLTNTAYLQSPGYDVNKYPELSYYKVGTSLWEDRLTYYSESRVGAMQIDRYTDTPLDRGFASAASMTRFGIPNTTRFSMRPGLAGIPDRTIFRADTRHEIQAPLKVSIFDVVPYVSGRATLYSDDFSGYMPDSEQYRLSGTGGVRIATQVSRVYDRVEDPVLDLHRIRHVIEPSLDLFYSGTTVEPWNNPVFDQDVEGISEGAGVRIGLKNTLQTQRGGPGRWRSVDWLTVNTELVLRSGDSDNSMPITRFFGYRPEYTVGGNHFHAEVMWAVTETLGLVGDVIHNMETGRIEQWRVGASMDHTPRLKSFVDVVDTSAFDEMLMSYGFTYRLAPKYTFSFVHILDLRGSGSRAYSVILERELPQWRFRLFINHDDIENEETFGIQLTPEGTDGSPALLPFVNQWQD